LAARRGEVEGPCKYVTAMPISAPRNPLIANSKRWIIQGFADNLYVAVAF